MRKSVICILGLALLSLGYWTPTAEEQSAFKVITHPDNPVTSLSKSQVSKILLKKVRKWEHGQRVQAVDQGGGQTVREIFTKEIHGRSLSSIQRFWQRQIFSGTEVPPPELAGDSAVVDFVSSNPGAIGYVSADASVEGVKVVDVTEK